MPELPEVETIRGQLERYLKGHKIVGVEVKTAKVFSGEKKNLIGGKIKNVRRFAKVLSMDLSNGYSIVAHIKLTGQFIYRGLNLKSPPDLSKKVVGGVPGKHTHVTFNLDKGGLLYYNDVRRFGWIKVVRTDEVEKIPFVQKLGPEPFVTKNSSGQALLTLNLFKQILAKSGRPIKIVLMDQEKIGGVGNIYANDALWFAAINPRRPANNLQPEEQEELYKAILEVLKRGLKWGGASELAFVTPDGSEGKYQKHTLAYGREGQLCPRCNKAPARNATHSVAGGKFQKFFLSGRGTYFCPVCQK